MFNVAWYYNLIQQDIHWWPATSSDFRSWLVVFVSFYLLCVFSQRFFNTSARFSDTDLSILNFLKYTTLPSSVCFSCSFTRTNTVVAFHIVLRWYFHLNTSGLSLIWIINFSVFLGIRFHNDASFESLRDCHTE